VFWSAVLDVLLSNAKWVLPLLVCVWLLFVLWSEERTNKLRAVMFKLTHRLSHSTRAEKRFIQYDIASRLGHARKAMPFGKAALPRSVRVKWVEGGDGKSVKLGDGDLIVRLDPMSEQEKNIVLLAEALVKRTSLVGVRHVMSGPLESALDLNLVRALLEKAGNREALDWFLKQDYHPRSSSNPESKEWTEKLHGLDRKGLFTRLLLVELNALGRCLPSIEGPLYIRSEIHGLINFIHGIASKPVGADVPLHYASRHVRIGVVLVGKSWKVAVKGTVPYVRMVAKYVRKQVGAVYVFELPRGRLGYENPALYQRIQDTLDALPQDIEAGLEITKDFSLSFDSWQESGDRETVRLHRYVTEFSGPK